MNQHQFPGFAYTAEQLSAYIFSIDTFIISLKNEQIIRHIPSDPEVFKKWLNNNNVRNINNEIGTLVYNHYFRK